MLSLQIVVKKVCPSYCLLLIVGLFISQGNPSSSGEKEVNMDLLTLFACGIAVELESFSSSGEEK